MLCANKTKTSKSSKTTEFGFRSRSMVHIALQAILQRYNTAVIQDDNLLTGEMNAELCSSLCLEQFIHTTREPFFGRNPTQILDELVVVPSVPTIVLTTN